MQRDRPVATQDPPANVTLEEWYATFAADAQSTDSKSDDDEPSERAAPYQNSDPLAIPDHGGMKPGRMLTPITRQLCTFFVTFGILYILNGVLIVALETAIIMYSSSTFYRGFSIGCTMSAIGINFLMVAFSRCYLIVYLVRILVLLVIGCAIGVPLTVADLLLMGACEDEGELPLCQKNIARDLKLVLLAFCVVGGIYSGVLIVLVKRIHQRTVLKPPEIKRNDSIL